MRHKPKKCCLVDRSMFHLQVCMMTQLLNPGNSGLKVQLSHHDWEGDGARLSLDAWQMAGGGKPLNQVVVGGEPANQAEAGWSSDGQEASEQCLLMQVVEGTAPKQACDKVRAQLEECKSASWRQVAELSFMAHAHDAFVEEDQGDLEIISTTNGGIIPIIVKITNPTVVP